MCLIGGQEYKENIKQYGEEPADAACSEHWFLMGPESFLESSAASAWHQTLPLF